MLLDDETQRLIDRLLDEGLSRYSAFAIGETLADESLVTIGAGANDAVLVQAYLAGKVAAEIGMDNARRMTVEQMQSVIETRGVEITQQDREIIHALSIETEQWITGRIDFARSSFRERVQSLDQQYRGELGNMNSMEGIEALREGFVGELTEGLDAFGATVEQDIDRVNQTQMAGFFNGAYVAGAGASATVWKLPRSTAEKHCLRIYLNPDGSPRTFTLGKVRPHSNIGRPAPTWQFVVGPTHPHCYCILYTSDDKAPLGASGSRARAFGSAVNPSDAGIGRLQRSAAADKIEECCADQPEPSYMKRGRKAVASVFGDDNPAR